MQTNAEDDDTPLFGADENETSAPAARQRDANQTEEGEIDEENKRVRPRGRPRRAGRRRWGALERTGECGRAALGRNLFGRRRGAWSRVDACARLAWDVEFLVGDVSNFMLQRTLGTHREYADDPLMAGVLEMVRERVKWSFHAAKGIEKALPVLCGDVQYEDKAGELVLETLRQALK